MEERREFEKDIEASAIHSDSLLHVNVGDKYKKQCKGVEIDVYDVLHSFSVINPAIAHAVKKLLAGGERGYKSKLQDYHEAIVSIERAIQLEEQ